MKIIKNYFATYFLILILLLPSFSVAAGRGLKRVKIRDKKGKQVALFKESHALVIGIGDYTNGWPKLPGVAGDVKAVSEVLEELGFNVEIVKDPNRRELTRAFEDFINKYGNTIDARLLFYFAGHGHTLELSYGGEMGYIVPVDAPNPNKNRRGFLSKAIDMQMIEVYAKRIQSKHALFLFDSCFSGSIFSMTRAIPENISYKTAKPVRQFITSGSANEQVPDESVFRRQFVEALKGAGDVNKDGYVTGGELGEFLQGKVVNYSRGTQHPQYGKIRDPNLDKGDFVFLIKNKENDAAMAAVKAEEDEHKLIRGEKLRLEKKELKHLIEQEKIEAERRKIREEKLKIEREELESLRRKKAQKMGVTDKENVEKEIVEKKKIEEKKVEVQKEIEEVKDVKDEIRPSRLGQASIPTKPRKKTVPIQKKAKTELGSGPGIYLGFRPIGGAEKAYLDDLSEDVDAQSPGTMLTFGGSWHGKYSEFRLFFDVNAGNDISYSSLGMDLLLYFTPKKSDSFTLVIGGGAFIPSLEVNTDYSGSTSGFGGKMMTGIQYFIGSNAFLELQAEVRSTSLSKLEIDGLGEVAEVTLIGAGINFNLGVKF